MQHEIFEEKEFALKENNLRGAVKSCFHQDWLVREKKGELIYRDCLDRHLSLFNPQGYLVAKTYYSIGKKSVQKPLNESITFKVSCEYLDGTHITRKTTTNKNGNKVIYLNEYEYDDEKRVIREYHFMGEHDGYSQREFEYRYEYLVTGCKRTIIRQGGTIETETSLLDHKGREIAKSTLAENGEQVWEKSEWDYDDVALTETLYWSEDNFLRKTYDEQGRLVETLSMREGKLYERQCYEYNTESLLVKDIYENEDGFCASSEYFYDEYQNLIRVKHTKQRAKFTEQDERTMVYEYDKRGNWLTKKFYENKKLQEMIKREIEYFE